jgi:hypothetical protein
MKTNTKKRTKKKVEALALRVRVVGYLTDEGTWAAHCLETDLVGYGNTWDAALDNLIELTEMQISFALYKQEPSLLDKPAPSHIFEMYFYSQREAMRRLVSERKKPDKTHEVATIPLLRPSRKAEFRVATA